MEERLYTIKEVAKILSVSDYRPKDGVKRGVLIPTDIQKSGGRSGFRYVFNADAIRSYANVLHITPDFTVVGATEDTIYEDGSVELTPENFDKIVHGNDKEQPKSKDAKFLIEFSEAHSLTNKDLAYILGHSEKRICSIKYGAVKLSFEDVMALCLATGVANISFNIEDYFASDPERYKQIKSWVPYEKAVKLKEYSDLQEQMKALKARMKELDKELKTE